jgi:hypothetical protein
VSENWAVDATSDMELADTDSEADDAIEPPPSKDSWKPPPVPPSAQSRRSTRAVATPSEKPTLEVTEEELALEAAEKEARAAKDEERKRKKQEKKEEKRARHFALKAAVKAEKKEVELAKTRERQKKRRDAAREVRSDSAASQDEGDSGEGAAAAIDATDATEAVPKQGRRLRPWGVKGVSYGQHNSELLGMIEQFERSGGQITFSKPRPMYKKWRAKQGGNDDGSIHGDVRAR